MVGRIVNKSVVGENNALSAAAGCAIGIYIALCPAASRGIGKKTFTVAEAVAADCSTGDIFLYTATAPSGVLRLTLGNKVLRQAAISVDIKLLKVLISARNVVAN